MTSKELHIESSSLNLALAGNIVKNISRLESIHNVRILSRGTLFKVTGENPSKVENVTILIKNLIELSESGHVISQKDFEAFISGTSKALNAQDIKDFNNQKIKVGPKKGSILPRTANQNTYIKDIRNKEIVFGVGPAGTGKTYLAMALAISHFLEGRHNRIILTRPAMEAGENLGFLPGTLEEKIKPYLRPLYDALYDMIDFEEAKRLLENNIIEVAPLAFMRGRTLNNSFIILDEAQNTTVEQMMMFLTRIGFESKCVITGDPTQTDLPGNKKSGLNHACRILRDIDEISIIKFSTVDVVRNPLIEKIINAYGLDKKRNTKQTERINNVLSF